MAALGHAQPKRSSNCCSELSFHAVSHALRSPKALAFTVFRTAFPQRFTLFFLAK